MQAVLKMLFCIITLLVLVGCQNTIEGFGKDMQQNGEKIQKSN